MHELSRRKFLSGLGVAGTGFGYSLVVHAEPSLTRAPEEIREALDALSPEASGGAPAVGEPHMRVVDLQCDFFVAGGGMAGVCAALAAARHGAKVILAQDRSRLGGNASSEVRMHIVGADCSGGRPGWREGGIIEELRLEYTAQNPHCAWELWDLMLYDKLVSEPNVTLLLDSAVYGAVVEAGRIQQALVRCDKTEHIYRIQSKLYADCTGDCRLGLEAGAKLRVGHEARAEFNEPLAPETAGVDTLGSSVLFTSKDCGKPMPYTPPSWARKVTKEQLQFRGVNSWEYGYWWIEWGGQHNAIWDNERIRFELLSIVLGVWDYIKNSGNHPESANWALDWTGMIPGKRASRRLEGPHILTQQDCMGLNGPFEDAVAIGGWPFDDHPPGGFDEPNVKPAQQIQIEQVYNIPLRSLYSANIANLLMAGRNISASHVAFTSTRVMATCAVEGQAIGTAAALCVAKGILPMDLAANSEMLKALQQVLLRDDQTIAGLRNEDLLDLARAAKVTASDELPGTSASSVIDGTTRDAPGEWLHRWEGDIIAGGVWVELHWDQPQVIAEVQLCFDSGFERPLTLTEQLGYRKKMVMGPQPELIRDYRVETVREDGTSQTLVRVNGNFQRIRRHSFDEVSTKTLRVHVTATNGETYAHIYEIRCYTNPSTGTA